MDFVRLELAPIVLPIATIEATLVILFFMHVIHSTRLKWMVSSAPSSG